jgi:hypothetical protein
MEGDAHVLGRLAALILSASLVGSPAADAFAGGKLGAARATRAPTVTSPGLGAGRTPDLGSLEPSLKTPEPLELPGDTSLPDLSSPDPLFGSAPIAAAPVVRLRCEIAPESDACREPVSADGGGGGEECSCSQDYCHYTESGTRICEKQ